MTDVQRRPGGRSSRVRAQVLDATVTLVARHGVAGLRYDEVAELAGVNRASVYRRWPRRDALISEALADLADREAPIGDTGDLRADLVEFLVTLAASQSSPLGRALAGVLHTAGSSPDVRRVVQAFYERRTGTLHRRITRAVDRGELPPVDAHLLADLLAGPVHLHATHDTGAFTPTDATRIVDIVLAGIRVTGDQRP
ncbi:TetR/AcrR family transcriptional regulator [Catenuloplanes atrovinosus]|uniref:AcrR family transcriptional regulator n=1 Tax=Catenuloplanes atrovinosus TaxID=137266 RepID=A0AAE3YRJ4_9ACTN|nr:TetR/AcrR family transcriptional regulator [Catenuloplanes atrovinosus]MDR7277029.1 AcrR family transcriptional regulator [Catenuloplanes atrovinosus]